MVSPTEQARRLLRKLGVEDVPVDVEGIAYELGAQVSYHPFDDDNISGMLVRKEDLVLISINQNHPPTRQRFSIAHEIGHLKLHEGRKVIIDEMLRVEARVDLRDDRSAQASSLEEIQANKFAAELLMPEKVVKAKLIQAMSKHRKEQSTKIVGQVVRELATIFDVSKQAMQFRLVNLGHLSQPH